MMNKRDVLKLLAAGSTLGLAGCIQSKQNFNAVDITGADYAKDFSLKDANGATRTMADFKGKVVVLFFGFAQCPDVCPTTMTEMAQVKQQLGADGDKLQVVFVTVDPDRDTPEVMKEFLSSSYPRFTGLTGSAQQVDLAKKSFRVFATETADPDDPDSYQMPHTAFTYVLGPGGQYLTHFTDAVDEDELVTRLSSLLR